ncbi:SprT family protein [Halobacillus litoralis]|uniref:SprT family protein n=1 Tax=Halobacillus litoralis TaxID=45668 RepID=UPI001CD1E551|nr:SprT family protein [Halobacillus litoralis]MCA0972781.1 SprT family protein [Halobacillus litoralis]
MEQSALRNWTNELSETYFSKPFVDDVMFNPRLRTTGGRYIPSKRVIELNPKYLKELGEEEFAGIIKHELCHYHLHIEGKGFGHGDPEFKELLRVTGSPRHCSPLPSERVKTYHQYQCQSCGKTYERKRKVDTSKYCCGKCKGKLKKISKIH